MADKRMDLLELPRKLDRQTGSRLVKWCKSSSPSNRSQAAPIGRVTGSG